MNKKRIIIFGILLFCLLFRINGVYALSNAIFIGYGDDSDEVLDNTNTENAAKTAFYDFENNILTLNNYNGKPIKYIDGDPLTVILKGTNTITDDFWVEGFNSASSLTFMGTGSLIIKNAVTGINLGSGTLSIDNTHITIQNPLSTGINVRGDVDLNGKISMDANLDEIEAILGYYEVYNAISVTKDIKINGGELLIKNSSKGLDTNKDLIVNSGDLSIESTNQGIHCANKFSMLGGNLNVELITSEYPLSRYGIEALSMQLSGGNLYVKGGENDIAFIAIGTEDDNPNFEISDKMKITPNTYSVQDILLNSLYAAKTIGTSKDSIASEVKIFSKIIVTFNTTGGSSIDNLIIDVNDKIVKPTNPTKENYIFDGWYIDEELTKQFDFNTTITKDTTLYAKWREAESFTYEFIDGNNQELTFGDIKSYVLKIDGDYSLFKNLKIGNLDLIKDEDYEVTEGSTVITFTDKGIAKLNTLSKGEYEILVKYTNSKEVKGKVILNSEIENPKTGDNYTTYIITGIISLIGVISISFYTRRKLVK